MRRIPSADPDLLVYASGGGVAALIGLLLAAAGGFLVSIPFWMDRASRGRGSDVGLVVFLGALMGVLGLGLLLWRSGMVMDRRQRVVTRWWGLLAPMGRAESDLAAFDRVAIAREIRRSKNSTYTVFPVALAGESARRVPVGQKGTTQGARQLGEELAKFLGLRLADGSMGAEVVREAGELDESLRQRARRTGPPPAPPEPPAGLRVRTSVVGDTLVLDFPARGFGAGSLALMGLGVAIPLVAYAAILRPLLQDKARGSEKAWLLIPFALVFLLVPLATTWGIAVGRALRSVLVEVSPSVLRVTRRGLLGPRVVELAADQLEELAILGVGAVEGRPAIAGGPGRQEIVARSDTGSVAFGAGLAPAELAWVKAVIENVVTA